MFSFITHNFCQSFRTDLSLGLKDSETHDVTFLLDDNNTISANKGLLSIISPVFKKMFNNGMKESKTDEAIKIIDIEAKHFKSFILYFYGQQPNLSQYNIGALSYCANKYMVKGLTEHCMNWLRYMLCISNIIDVLKSLLINKQERCQDVCIKWMQKTKDKSMQKLFKPETFNKLSISIVRLLLKGFGFGNTIEATELWSACLLWTEQPLSEEDIKLLEFECKNKNLNYNNLEETNTEEKCNNNKTLDPSIPPSSKRIRIGLDNNKSTNDSKDSKHKKLKSIVNYFPFHRLDAHYLKQYILPLKILSSNQLLEILSHKVSNNNHLLSIAQEAIKTQSFKLSYPKAEYIPPKPKYVSPSPKYASDSSSSSNLFS